LSEKAQKIQKEQKRKQEDFKVQVPDFNMKGMIKKEKPMKPVRQGNEKFHF